MSRLRARCPDCRALTAVALGNEYQCHVCGREFRAGLVRVPRAWGEGGEAMAEAAHLRLPLPETVVVDEESLGEQTLALASDLPQRPLVLGGCCCTHVGAVEGLAARHPGLALVWLDAHGDLNTPESSPSGNAWGMPLRMLVDSGAIDVGRVALVGARCLDPPEEEFLAETGLLMGARGISGAVSASEAVYVALDLDVLDPAEASPFMPEPDGLSVDEVEGLLAGLAEQKTIVGAGFTGLVPDERNVPVLERLLAALRM
jgi:arginase